MSLVPLVMMAAVSPSYGQNFNSSTFFDPELRVQHSQIVLGALVDYGLVTGSTAPGAVTWTNGAGGYSGVALSALLGVHLHAYTETTGTSLVFGRDLDVNGLLAGLEDELETVVDANVLSSWSATANVTGLNIMAGQLYEVTFDISSGPNLEANLISSGSFDVTSAGVTSFGEGSAGLLNLLNVVTIGTDPDTGVGRLQFVSSTNRSDLQFQFLASSAVSLGLLGDIPGNQNVLTFSNVQVQAIPEPSALALSALAAGGVILRRRRGK